jgi:hypothetical protein
LLEFQARASLVGKADPTFALKNRIQARSRSGSSTAPTAPAPLGGHPDPTRRSGEA